MLSRLVLRGFRNYREVALDFNAGDNVLHGLNGQGKTNILEAIYLLANLRSFRTSRIYDLKMDGGAEFYVGGLIDVPTDDGVVRECRLEISYGQKRRLSLDGRLVPLASDFIRHFRAVVFSPLDINIVIGGAAVRRGFFDMFISSVDFDYLRALRDYQVALKSRNNLLRRGASTQRTLIEPFERLMVENGVFLVARRKWHSERLAAEAAALIGTMKGGEHSLALKYQHPDETGEFDTYATRLASSYERDIRRGCTGIGPHLDDFDIVFDGVSARSYGSTGQCRLVSLAVKLAQLKILLGDTRFSGNVVALVDDVTGELDEPTTEAFFKVLDSSNQRFFTFTKIPEGGYFAGARKYSVESGRVVAA